MYGSYVPQRFAVRIISTYRRNRNVDIIMFVVVQKFHAVIEYICIAVCFKNIIQEGILINNIVGRKAEKVRALKACSYCYKTH